MCVRVCVCTCVRMCHSECVCVCVCVHVPRIEYANAFRVIPSLNHTQVEGAASEKHRLEEKQRAARKRREESGETWSPR